MRDLLPSQAPPADEILVCINHMNVWDVAIVQPVFKIVSSDVQQVFRYRACLLEQLDGDLFLVDANI